MNQASNPTCLIVGLGSIGKTHLKHILRFAGKIVVVDPNPQTIDYIQAIEFPVPIEYHRIIELVPKDDLIEFAVISNWGPDHFSLIQEVAKLGVRHLLVEKPLVSKLHDLEELKRATLKGELKVITNMPISQGPLANRVLSLQLEGKLGQVQTILVSGGAKCLVTNGIHYIDLASKIFQSHPVSVFSSIENHSINPRSVNYVFAEGNSSWSYGNGKNLSISFSNNSHVQLSISIICKYGKIVIDENLATVFCISEKDIKRIDKPTRTFYPREVIDSFQPYHFLDGLDGLGSLYAQIQFLEEDVWDNFEDGYRATEAVIGMLISSETCSKVDLPLVPKVKEKYLSREWNIS
jgi:predicted dehydrogenase